MGLEYYLKQIEKDTINKTCRLIKSRPGAPIQKVENIVVHSTSRSYDSPAWVRFRHIFFRGWDDNGYHYMIANGTQFTEDGKLYKCRDEKYQGAHVKGHNQNTLSVSMVGDFDSEKPTEKQMGTLIDFLAEKAVEYNLPAESIKGHREYPGVTKTCPGKNVDMDYIREHVRNKIAGKITKKQTLI